MSDDRLNPEIRGRMAAATKSMLERMTAAGWIQSARNEKGVVIEWTESGTQAAKQFRVLFDKLGDELFADEMMALLTIIDTMSPGGTEAAHGHKV